MGCWTSSPCPLHVPDTEAYIVTLKGSAVGDRLAWKSVFSSESILPMSPRKPRRPLL